MTDVSVSLLPKRKRGRPRKDGNLSRVGTFPENRAFMKTQHISPIPNDVKKTQEEVNPKDGSTTDGMVGSMIYGVIEGSFDAGYLISVRIGNNDTPYRGVVFQPRKFIPVSAANDVAPQAKMCQRREIPVPAYDDLSRISAFSPQPENVTFQSLPASKQPVFRPVSPSVPLQATPYSLNTFNMPHETIMMGNSSSSNVEIVGVDKRTGSLRMVEQDDVMQAYEISTLSKGSPNNTATTSLADKESINQKPPQVHGKAVESGDAPSMVAHEGSSMELHHSFVEHMPQLAFGIQHSEMVCREMEHQKEFAHSGPQNSTIELQSVPRAPLYFNEMRSPDVNFHEYHFTNQGSQESRCLGPKFHPDEFVDSISKSPNLKLDLSSTIHQKRPQASDSCLGKNYLGYHQALVTGNPLLLPPDLIGDHTEFILQKPRSPPNQKTPRETCNSEVESRAGAHAQAAGSPSAPYKLELATPTGQPAKQMAPAGCITDMDFVLSDVVQTADSHGHRSNISETKHRWSE
ncbi:hypothetical protein CDL12_06154 [Handroanthus impetiginosus]|uniref:AT hook motif-containing protein n=1 Tax=Handroanthus impetiginosus TaxID=429701 RepID=A0A2G9HUL7_9LAMI|nr:hypothetical protein CDL12_06154 [Handroanthus impetiginosus]